MNRLGLCEHVPGASSERHHIEPCPRWLLLGTSSDPFEEGQTLLPTPVVFWTKQDSNIVL